MRFRANPFVILGASPRMGPHELGQLRESKGLFGDEAACAAALAQLASPTQRLAAEVSWLPGLSSIANAAAIAALETETLIETPVAVLARVNLDAHRFSAKLPALGSKTDEVGAQLWAIAALWAATLGRCAARGSGGR